MPINKPLNRTSFNSGELDPALFFRPDIQKYGNGCKKLENFLINPTGGIKRRPQTRFMAALPDDTSNVRVLPFEFSNDEIYAVVLLQKPDENVYLQVYANDGTQEFEVEVDYPADDLQAIQYVQSYDVLFLTHEAVKPMRLERRESDWAFVEQTFLGGPYDQQNTDREKVITLAAMPWVDDDSYVVGDYVVDVDAADLVDVAGFDISTIEPTPYKTITLENGNTRKYKTLLIEVPEVTVIPDEGFVLFRNVASPIDEIPFWISSVILSGGNPTKILLESGLYVEETSGAVLVEDQLADAGFPIEQGTVAGGDGDGTVQVYFAPVLTKDYDIYKCIQDTSSDGLGAAAYWEKVGIYQGDLIARASTEDFWSNLGIEADEYFAYRDNLETSLKGSFWYSDGSGFTSDNEIYLTYSGDPNSPASYSLGNATNLFPAFGKIKLETKGGTWAGRLRLQTSEDGGLTWETIGVIESSGNNNERIEREVERSGTLGRLIFDEANDVSGGPFDFQGKCLFTVNVITNQYVETLFKEVYDAPSIARLDLQYPITESGETFKWATRAFNVSDGYPSTLTIFEERLWFAGVPATSNTVYASAIDDFDEWGEGTFETSPLQFTISSDQFNPIISLLPQQNLSIFTTGAEHSIGSRNSQEVLSGTTVSARRHSQYGSSPIKSIMMQEIGVYIRRDAKTPMGITFTDEFSPYASGELNSFASHIGGTGITELALIKSPENYLFCLREDGQVAVLTYERQQEVTGWSRLLIGDSVLSIAAVPAPKYDRVYMAVQRGSEVFLESMIFDDPARLDWYVEANESVEDEGIASFDLPYDTALDVEVWSGYQLLELDVDYTRSGVTITPNENHSQLIAGVSYTHEVETTDLEISPTGKGGSARIIACDLYHGSAAGGKFRYSETDDWQEIVWHTMNGENLLTLDNARPRRTEINITSRVSDQLSIAVRGSLPADFELYAIALNAERTQ